MKIIDSRPYKANYVRGLIKLVTLFLFLWLHTIEAEVQKVIFKWNAAICREECIPYLEKQLKEMPGVANYTISSHAGIATVGWKPNQEFSFGYFNFASRSVGMRILDIRVQVRGTIVHYYDKLYLVSLGDGSRFELLGPLLTQPNSYTIKANIANHPLPADRLERLLEAERKNELVTIEGPLFEPQWYRLAMIVEKVTYPKPMALQGYQPLDIRL